MCCAANSHVLLILLPLQIKASLAAAPAPPVHRRAARDCAAAVPPFATSFHRPSARGPLASGTCRCVHPVGGEECPSRACR
eukprot:3517040-Pyramimonas_sp.AAC.1